MRLAAVHVTSSPASVRKSTVEHCEAISKSERCLVASRSGFVRTVLGGGRTQLGQFSVLDGVKALMPERRHGQSQELTDQRSIEHRGERDFEPLVKSALRWSDCRGRKRRKLLRILS